MKLSSRRWTRWTPLLLFLFMCPVSHFCHVCYCARIFHVEHVARIAFLQQCALPHHRHHQQHQHHQHHHQHQHHQHQHHHQQQPSSCFCWTLLRPARGKLFSEPLDYHGSPSCFSNTFTSSCSSPSSFTPPPLSPVSPPSSLTSSSAQLSVLFHLRRHLFRRKKWRRLVYGIGTANEPVASPTPPPLDSMFLGKYRAIWTVEGFKEKLRWRYREMKTSALKTSRFCLAHYRGLQLKLWPDGHEWSKPGYMAISLYQPERWEPFEDDLCLFVGKIKRGPFKYLSPEYVMASQSFCRLEDLDIVDDKLQVGVEISAL
eukprot:GHVS01032874.1.p1 GENE.GHVS01032874.1~~GHVS01032874.1.p1  ORF type:complete len:315 (-),score=67.29 GHVS01032874.1:190-1134(-)